VKIHQNLVENHFGKSAMKAKSLTAAVAHILGFSTCQQRSSREAAEGAMAGGR